MSEIVEIVKSAAPAFFGALAGYMAIRENIVRLTERLDALKARFDRVESRMDNPPSKS